MKQMENVQFHYLFRNYIITFIFCKCGEILICEIAMLFLDTLWMKANQFWSICVPQTMIEAHVDVKTTDGYLLRLFCVGFTKKRTNQIRKTSYAQHQQVRQIRKKMMEIMTREVQTNDLKEVVNKL